MADTDLTQQIASAAAKPNSVSIDGTTVTKHSLTDQIAAAKFLGADDALRTIANGGRFISRRINPPGARGTCDGE